METVAEKLDLEISQEKREEIGAILPETLKNEYVIDEDDGSQTIYLGVIDEFHFYGDHMTISAEVRLEKYRRFNDVVKEQKEKVGRFPGFYPLLRYLNWGGYTEVPAEKEKEEKEWSLTASRVHFERGSKSSYYSNKLIQKAVNSNQPIPKERLLSKIFEPIITELKNIRRSVMDLIY